ncbi:hypothetical protein ACE1CB_18605 [Aerosakkonema sp. BLCC-F2]
MFLKIVETFHETSLQPIEIKALIAADLRSTSFSVSNRWICEVKRIVNDDIIKIFGI